MQYNYIIALGDIHDYIIYRHSCACFYRYSVLSRLNLGSKTFLYMLVGSTTLACSLASL